jgi:lipid II:glycine glycyltransferase (peptidoglycan interpeptide bridge formation enzyme)
MKLIEIKDKNIYNKFVSEQKHSQFLQSWEWGEFQNFNVGTGQCPVRTAVRHGIEDNNKLIFVLTLIKKNIGLGKSYYYAPRIGIKNLNEEQLNFLFEEIRKVAKQEGVLFLRFEPRHLTPQSPLLIRRGEASGNERGEVRRTLDVQPRKTLILDISKSEEELLKNFKQKTRYNIRLAGKKGVVVREMKDEKDFENWWRIMEETKDRDGFRLHSKNYYRKMLTSPQPSPCKVEGVNLVIKLILAEYEGEIIAGNIVSFFGDMATYVHGASSNKFRNVMAPYLLQWEAIKMAKKLGFKYYDFYGIDENKWPGVTRFKLGFNGEEINYPGTFDLVFNNIYYNLYKIIRKLRRLI